MQPSDNSLIRNHFSPLYTPAIMLCWHWIVYSRQHRKARPLFAALDILLIWLALEAAYSLRSNLVLPRYLPRLFYLDNSTKYLLLLFAVLAWVVIALWLRLYDRLSWARWPEIAARTLQQTLWAGLAVVVFQFLLRLDLSRPFLAFFFFFAFLFLLTARLLTRAVAPHLWRGFSALRYVVVMGTGHRAMALARQVEAAADYGLALLFFLDRAPGTVRLSKDYEVRPFQELPRLLEEHVIDEILVSIDRPQLSELEDLLLLCDEEGVRTRLDISYFPHVNSRVSLERLGEEPLLTFAASPHDEFALIVKRATDLLLASLALLLAAPLMLLIALLIRLTSPGPALFRQQRCGLSGRKFILYKFRTMVADAEARRKEIEHLNVKKTAFKIPNDPRLTALGRWLRKFSLDELPQLWNIVRGEMAIVGPRPPVPSEVAEYQRWQRRRLRMRPGLTCLWTLAGRDALDFDEWMKLDLAYIDNWSLKLDWSIMLRTIPHVLSGKGAN